MGKRARSVKRNKGMDPRERARIAEAKLVAKMEERIPQLDNIRIEFRATQPQLALKIDRRRASDLGVTMADLAATVKALVDKDEVALRHDQEFILIFVPVTQRGFGTGGQNDDVRAELGQSGGVAKPQL